MVVLALATGIAPQAWIDEGDQAIVTAWEILEQQQAGNRRDPPAPRPGASGRKWTKSNPQMSG